MSIPEKDYDKALDRIEELEALVENYRADNEFLRTFIREQSDLEKRIEELEALLKDADEAHDEIQEELSAQVAENKRLNKLLLGDKDES